MKYPSHSRVVDILRKRELELFAIRSNFEKLQDKFFQLENAFRINLDVQRRLECELELYKHGEVSVSEKSKTNSVDKVEGKNVKARSVLYSRLMKVRIEKKRWKDAFLHQKKITDKRKLEHRQSIEIIRNECEEILKNCRETGEKHFRELLELYENSSEKVKHFEEALNASKARAISTSERILELANLLETLEKFQGVRTEVVCQRTTRALRSLETEGETTYQEDMKHLRQVTWDISENDKNHETLEFLQTQNSVLREVVKSLKRKLHDKFHEVSASDENANETEKKDNPENLRESTNEKCDEKSEKQSSKDAVKDVEKSTKKAANKRRENKEVESEEEIKQPLKSNRNPKRIYVDAFESHRHGMPYVEYVFHFFDDRQFRVGQSTASTTKDSTMVVEFVDSVKDFEGASVDRTVFYLGDKVERIVSLKNAGVHCGVQTNRIKTLEKCIQTSMTGAKGFSRVNAGVGILNSEKRAIERSLVNLECTVASLKADALGQARSMIESNTEVLDDEFFNCVERLRR